MPVRWIGEVAADGDVAFRIGRDGDELVAEWIDLCELRADRRGERVSLAAHPDADPRVIAKVERGLGAALVRQLRGETSLHASTVSKGGRAVAFLGRSGAGKSTLAAHACGARGFELLADDVVAVHLHDARADALPTEADHWLDAASRARLGLPAGDDGKHPVAARRVASAPARLVALVALGADTASEHVELVRLRGHAALAALVPCLVRFVIDEPEEQIHELERASSLVARVPLFELRWKRSFVALDAALDAVEELMR